jgi:hypothetical protein
MAALKGVDAFKRPDKDKALREEILRLSLKIKTGRLPRDIALNAPRKI